MVALELVFTTKRLCVTEAAQAVRDAGVLLDVDLQVEEVLVDAAHCLAVEAARLARQDALEDLLDPGRLLGIVRRAILAGAFRLDVVRGGVLLLSFGEYDLADAVDEEIEELVSVLLHVIIELLLFLP